MVSEQHVIEFSGLIIVLEQYVVKFCIDTVVGKPIINKCLFYIFKFIKEDSFWER